MISNFRVQHGEGRVTLDATLDRIAREQAVAMAEKDVLDHSVLGQFSARIGPSGSRRAAENIAYGYDSFPKTLNQWIESPEHRKNLLLPNASRVGIASAMSTVPTAASASSALAVSTKVHSGRIRRNALAITIRASLLSSTTRTL
jgi:uncharacterized protein YkwD